MCEIVLRRLRKRNRAKTTLTWKLLQTFTINSQKNERMNTRMMFLKQVIFMPLCM